METSEQELKEIVRQKYSEIALQDKETNQASCCGSGCCSTEVYNIMSDDYNELKGYNDDILNNYLDNNQLASFKAGTTGIFSVTVYAEKSTEAKTCCGPDCCN